MVDPNRKINRLTDKDIEFLEECEREFSLRYSEEDSEFMEHCSKPLDDPPIVDNFGGGVDGTGRNYGGNRKHNRGGNRHHKNWRDNSSGYHDSVRRRYRELGSSTSRSSGGVKYDRANSSAKYNQRPSSNQNDYPPMNIRRDYSNFVAASKDD